MSSFQPVVDLEKKVLISASAIQLTFGLKDFRFRRFKTILIHDDAYYSRITHQYHRGEVNSRGLIVLSWKYFEEGYRIDDDKINLGLHEMAHALNLAIHLSEGRRYQLHRLMEKFEQSAFDEITEMRTGRDTFLRSYGATNAKEFFSVAVEHFFEAPCEFQEKLPELYIELCQLLNQDICNKVYRGYKSPHSNLYKNRIENVHIDYIKPDLNLIPNASLAIPLALISLFSALAILVIHTSVHTPTWTLTALLAALYLYLIYLTFSFKAKQVFLLDNHLCSKNYLLNNKAFSVQFKNIVNVNFTHTLSCYQTTISYFEGETIHDKKLSLYYSPASIKKLERRLLRKNIKIKHNSKWLKKESKRNSLE